LGRAALELLGTVATHTSLNCINSYIFENRWLSQRIAVWEVAQAAHGGRIATGVPETSVTGQSTGLSLLQMIGTLR
jgi:hypothetical protein